MLGGEKMRKFKAWLVENNIKQSEIAKLLGLSLRIVNAKLNGREPFTLAQVKTICLHYHISADEFFIN